MLHIHFEQFPELHTARLHLRQPHITDAPALFRMRSDAAVMQYIGRPLMTREEEAVQFLQLFADNYQKDDGITWVICLKDDPQFIGTIGLWRYDKPHYRAEVGYTLLPGFQGKGILTEALNEVIRFAFDQTGLHSLEAQLSPQNIASKRVLEKCGFVQEAHFRENFFWEGKFEDTLVYSLVRPLNAP